MSELVLLAAILAATLALAIQRKRTRESEPVKVPVTRPAKARR